MEVANIDWKNIDSRFVPDDLYEHISAPKWVDFSAPDEPVDDEAWFCRSSCKHPKTAEDFLNEEKKRTPSSNSKHRRSVSVSDIPPLGEKLKRDATLKKRGIHQPFELLNKDMEYYRAIEDGENRDPNFSTPTNHKATKEAIKSSADNKPTKDDPIIKNDRAPKLRSTLSARNLFSGGDILLSKVADFCNDLKKLATRTRDRENLDGGDAKLISQQGTRHRLDDNLDALNNQEKEREPLLELGKEERKVLGKSSGSKGKLRRKKRNEDGENTPICVDMNNVKGQESEKLLHIRTCPPTPQCFSAGHGHSTASTPPTPFRIRPLNQERAVLLEVKEMKKEINRVGVEKDARSLDVFWFLKPCTLSS